MGLEVVGHRAGPDGAPGPGPGAGRVDATVEQGGVHLVVVPVREVVGGLRGEAAQGDDRGLGLGADHGGSPVGVEELAAGADDQLEEGAEQARLASGEAEADPVREQVVPGRRHLGNPIAAHPQDADVDQPRQREQRALDPAEVDGTVGQRSDDVGIDEVVEVTQPLGLRGRVLGVGGQHVEALARREQLGDVPVERGVVGVHDDLDLAGVEQLVEVVVHGTADERHAEATGGGHGPLPVLSRPGGCR